MKDPTDDELTRFIKRVGAEEAPEEAKEEFEPLRRQRRPSEEPRRRVAKSWVMLGATITLSIAVGVVVGRLGSSDSRKHGEEVADSQPATMTFDNFLEEVDETRRRQERVPAKERPINIKSFFSELIDTIFGD